MFHGMGCQLSLPCTKNMYPVRQRVAKDMSRVDELLRE